MAIHECDLEHLKDNENEYDLVNMEHFIIDKSKPPEAQAEHFFIFFDKIKNPYHFMINKFNVTISYSNTNTTLVDKLQSYLSIINKD